MCFAGDQLTVRTCLLLVPPLEQPRSPVVPAGVFTVTLKLPGPGIMEDVMVAVSWEWLVTTVARLAPLNITTEEDTKWLPVAVMTKLGGSCEKTMFVGEIELRTGTARALPQRGFSVLHPGRIKSTTSHELRRTIRQEEGMYCKSETAVGLSHLIPLAVPGKLSNLTVKRPAGCEG